MKNLLITRMLNLLLSVVAWTLISLGGVLILANFGIVVSWLITRKRRSLLPFLGVVSTCVGMALHPSLRASCWVPLVADLSISLSATAWLVLCFRNWTGRSED